MRIISKWRDYYDSVMGHGQDLTTVFARKDEEVKKTHPLYEVFSQRDPYDCDAEVTRRPIKVADHKYMYYSTSTFRVYFCGKVYRGIRVVLFDRREFLAPSEQVECFYSFESLVEFLQTIGVLVQELCRGNFSSVKQNLGNLRNYLAAQGTDEQTVDLVNHRVIIAKFIPGHWTDHGAYDHGYWELNSSLAAIKFYKLIDPYTAYQELDMYISGVLGQQAKEVVKISDKDRVYQHGFDEYSFRKLPEEKKRKG